jgi:hypothetical protein
MRYEVVWQPFAEAGLIKCIAPEKYDIARKSINLRFKLNASLNAVPVKITNSRKFYVTVVFVNDDVRILFEKTLTETIIWSISKKSEL